MAITLANTDETLECGMAESPATQPDFICTFTDFSASAGTPGRQLGTLTDAANTILVASPGASTYRVIETVHITNRDAAAITLTPHFEEDTTEYEFGDFTVNSGEQLVYAQGYWRVNAATSANRLFAATLGAAQSDIANSTWTKVQFNTEVADPNSEFTSYIHTPKVAGYYLYTCSVLWVDIDDGNYAYAGLGKNWVSGDPSYYASARSPGLASSLVIPVTRLIYMNGSTDTMAVIALHSNGDATPDILNSAVYTWFSGVRISP